MVLTTKDIAKMFDLSCVQVKYTDKDLDELVRTAIKYDCGQISTFQSLLESSRKALEDYPEIHVVGNVSFPSGSDTTELKVIQAGQMVAAECDEIDMVLNINWLRSGLYDLVKQDIAAVFQAVGDLPLKVIIEVSQITDEQITEACRICMDVGVEYVKTGTGWSGPTTARHIKLIKSVVGESTRIKASGGVRNLDLLIEMYREGATRFGVNLESAKKILEESIRLGGSVKV